MGETGSGSVGSILIRERVGTSGLYRGEQPGLGRAVAIRKLRQDLLANDSLVARLEREARLAARVVHPNVIGVFDFFSHRGDQYLVMEWVDGLSLREALDRSDRVPPAVATLVAEQIAIGLAALHDRGILHTDLRPENVLLSRWGEVKLRGLGSACEVGEGGRVPPRDATPYSPPELWSEAKPGPACDTYALGLLLFEMLTGDASPDRAPPLTRDARPLGRLARRCAHPDPGRRPSLAALRARLERLKPRRSADESAAEIAAWLWEVSREREEEEPSTSESAQAAPSRLGTRARLPGRLAAASAALVLVAATWLLSWPQLQGGPEEPLLDTKGTLSRELFADLDAPLDQRSASVRFAVYPWAEVTIDDAEPFLTPRARPVELAPGSHQVAFRHPRFGEALRAYRFEPGEQRVVRHVFDAASVP